MKIEKLIENFKHIKNQFVIHKNGKNYKFYANGTVRILEKPYTAYQNLKYISNFYRGDIPTSVEYLRIKDYLNVKFDVSTLTNLVKCNVKYYLWPKFKITFPNSLRKLSFQITDQDKDQSRPVIPEGLEIVKTNVEMEWPKSLRELSFIGSNIKIIPNRIKKLTLESRDETIIDLSTLPKTITDLDLYKYQGDIIVSKSFEIAGYYQIEDTLPNLTRLAVHERENPYKFYSNFNLEFLKIKCYRYTDHLIPTTLKTFCLNVKKDEPIGINFNGYKLKLLEIKTKNLVRIVNLETDEVIITGGISNVLSEKNSHIGKIKIIKPYECDMKKLKIHLPETEIIKADGLTVGDLFIANTSKKLTICDAKLSLKTIQFEKKSTLTELCLSQITSLPKLLILPETLKKLKLILHHDYTDVVKIKVPSKLVTLSVSYVKWTTGPSSLIITNELPCTLRGLHIGLKECNITKFPEGLEKIKINLSDSVPVFPDGLKKLKLSGECKQGIDITNCTCLEYLKIDPNETKISKIPETVINLIIDNYLDDNDISIIPKNVQSLEYYGYGYEKITKKLKIGLPHLTRELSSCAQFTPHSSYYDPDGFTFSIHNYRFSYSLVRPNKTKYFGLERNEKKMYMNKADVIVKFSHYNI